MRKIKLSIIGAGAVGSNVAFLTFLYHLVPELVLVDIKGSLAKGLALDLEDGRFFLNSNTVVKGADKIKEISGSDIVVFTAGISRRPGMSREDLLSTNAKIAKEVALKVKKLAPASIVIVVTNPLDIITYVFCKYTGFKRERIIGMGLGLDASRLSNLIFHKIGISPADVSPWILGMHGKEMLVAKFTNIKGMSMGNFIDSESWRKLKELTVNRGAEVVKFLRCGSARFAPALGVKQILEAIVFDKRSFVLASIMLQGEYGIRNVCLGVPVLISRRGVDKILEVELDKEEKHLLKRAASYLSSCTKSL